MCDASDIPIEEGNLPRVATSPGKERDARGARSAPKKRQVKTLTGILVQPAAEEPLLETLESEELPKLADSQHLRQRNIEKRNQEKEQEGNPESAEGATVPRQSTRKHVVGIHKSRVAHRVRRTS